MAFRSLLAFLALTAMSAPALAASAGMQLPPQPKPGRVACPPIM